MTEREIGGWSRRNKQYKPTRKINLGCKEREEEKTGSEMKECIKRERKREKNREMTNSREGKREQSRGIQAYDEIEEQS